MTNKIKVNVVDSWEEVHNRLLRTYYFDNHDQVMEFVNKVSSKAKKMNQHPDMLIHENNVKLTLIGNNQECHKFALSVDKLKM